MPRDVPISRGSAALERALRKRGLSMAAAADLLGVRRHTVWRWLRGERVPSSTCIVALHRQFGVPPEAWVTAAAAA